MYESKLFSRTLKHPRQHNSEQYTSQLDSLRNRMLKSLGYFLMRRHNFKRPVTKFLFYKSGDKRLAFLMCRSEASISCLTLTAGIIEMMSDHFTAPFFTQNLNLFIFSPKTAKHKQVSLLKRRGVVFDVMGSETGPLGCLCQGKSLILNTSNTYF